MCGRFVQYSDSDRLQSHFDIDTVTCEVRPSYNIAPTQEVLGVIHHQDTNRMGKLHWGLVPSSARDLSAVSRHINARAETLAERATFREAFAKRRCLILADGFYEWKKENRYKQPWYFTMAWGDPFAFAGIWETWKNKNASVIYHSCAIITTQAAGSVRKIHHRMPAILLPELYGPWLDPATRETDQLIKILKKGLVQDMKGCPVSTRVNSVKNNDPACIAPLVAG